MDPIHEFRGAMLEAGLVPPELIEPGKLHRFSTNGQRGDDAGWCRLFPDLAGGVFGDFRSGLSESWQAQRSKPFSQAEREAFRRRCEAERQARQAEEAQRHAEAAKQAESILAVASEAPDGHAYAKKKAVPLGMHAKRGAWLQRNWKDALLLPVFGPDGKLLSVQAIHADGKKDFLKHSRTRGGFYPFGVVRGAELVLVGEGAATVAACVASWPCAAVAALSRDNLAAVGQAVRGLAPDAALVFLADNDAMPDGGNPGIAEARRAAALVGGHVAVPELDGRKCDFWDVWRERGPEAVRAAIAQAMPPAMPENEEFSPQRAPLPLENSPFGNLPPFPLGALPVALLEAAQEIARFDRVPVESPATIALSMMATAIGKQAVVEERAGLVHHPALFFALVAPSGERKTPPFKKLQTPFIQHIEEGRSGYERGKAEVEAHNAIIQARIKKLTKDAEKTDSATGRQDSARQIAALVLEAKPLPPDPRLFTNDYTEQVLFRLMESHGGEYALQSSEGRPVFDAILGKYSGEGRTGDSIILAGISGDTITRDRIGSAETGPEHGLIINPCLNVCVMVQPDKYLQTARHPNLRASGALARIFPVWLPSLVGSRLEQPGEEGLRESELSDYCHTVKRLLLAKAGRAEPHRARLSPEAAEGRRLFHNQVEVNMAEAGEYADVRDIASKATTQVVKLALVLHVAADPAVLNGAESEIALDTWARAEALGGFFLAQAVASQRHADEDATLEPARKLLAWMRREAARGKVVFRFADLQQYSPRPRPSARDLEAIMEVLADHQHVAKLDSGGKRPDYRLNGTDG